jgi:hypothetical protein
MAFRGGRSQSAAHFLKKRTLSRLLTTSSSFAVAEYPPQLFGCATLAEQRRGPSAGVDRGSDPPGTRLAEAGLRVLGPVARNT